MRQPQPARRPRALAAVSLCLALLLGAAPAAAQDPAAVAQIEAAYQRARAAYDEFELEQARFHIDSGLRLATTQGLAHPVLAKLHLMLGVLVFSQSRDVTSTEEAFFAGLQYDPQVEMEPSLSSPELAALLEQARRRVVVAPVAPTPGPADPPPLPPVEPPPSSGPPRLVHTPPTQVREGVNLPVYVELHDGAAAQRCVLRYRRADEAWSEIDLLPQGSGPGRSGYVPGSAVIGTQIEYFMQALDWAGTPLAQHGSEARPVVVPILRSAPGPAPIEPPPPGIDPLPPMAGTSSRILHMLLGVGTGGGVVKGHPLRHPDVELRTGVGPTLFHFYGELGAFATRQLLFLLATRVQMVIEDTEVFFEPLLSVRARWYFSESAPLRTFAGVGGGWCGFAEDCGYVQHYVDLRPNVEATDTVRAGNAHAGLEGGLTVDFTDNVGLQTSLFLYGLFGESPTFQADLNLGLNFTF